MKIKREWVIASFAWVLLISVIAFTFPSFVALYAQEEKPKPLAVERLSVDKDLTFVHQPAHQKSHDPPSCWYELHDLQGKSGTHRFPIECEAFHRLKARLTRPITDPPKAKPKESVTQGRELAHRSFPRTNFRPFFRVLDSLETSEK